MGDGSMDFNLRRAIRRLAARRCSNCSGPAAGLASHPAGCGNGPQSSAGSADSGARLVSGSPSHHGSSWVHPATARGAAITVGGLRISLLTVTKGVLSLTALLWAATLVSTVFDRRITRVTQITPRARVLLGKLLKTTLVSVAVLLSLTSIGVDLSTFA